MKSFFSSRQGKEGGMDGADRREGDHVTAVAVAVWLGLRIWRRRHTAD